jgi:hypothetical protein
MEDDARDQPFQGRKRAACVERRISDIRPEDIRVRITGTVIDSDGERMVIDDGSGRISATLEPPAEAHPGQAVRAFGRVLPMESGFELQAEFVQDVSGLDMEIYRKVSLLWSSRGGGGSEGKG